MTKNTFYIFIIVAFFSCVAIFGTLLTTRIKANDLKDPLKNFERLTREIKKKKITRKILGQELEFIKQNKNLEGALIALDFSKRHFQLKNYDYAIYILEKVTNYTLENYVNYIVKFQLSMFYIHQKYYSVALHVLEKMREGVWQEAVEKLIQFCLTKINKRYKFQRYVQS